MQTSGNECKKRQELVLRWDRAYAYFSMALLAQKPVSKTRVWLARGIAMAADAIQIGLMPLFSVPQPAEPVMDVIVAALMVLLVGWHIAFLPSIIVEGLPLVDLAPTWTIAVFIATRGGTAKEERSVRG